MCPNLHRLTHANPKHIDCHTCIQNPIEQMQSQTNKLTKDMKKMGEAVNELRQKLQVLDVMENYIKLMALKQGITSEQAEEMESGGE